MSLTSTITDHRRRSLSVPSVRVVVTPPSGPPAEAALGLSPICIGTSAECDLVIADPRVSRRHCELALTERGVVLRDLASKNGTFIRDIEVSEAVLGPDAVASIGGTQIVVRVVGPPSSVALSASGRFGDAIGQSVIMCALFARLERAATSAENVLLIGESGTGKELIARAIHEASPRRQGPFVVLDCSAVETAALEAELFGEAGAPAAGAHGPRAGCLQQASGGTLFIKELSELPNTLQAKVARALEARELRPLGGSSARRFDARIVAGTHRDLRAQVAAKQFREDLYYRLAVIVEIVPPLRERRDDIPLLVEHFLSAQDPPRTPADLAPNALELLKAHAWPGNVRELRNTVARMSLFPDLGAAAFAPPTALPQGSRTVGPLLALPLRQARGVMVETFERDYLAEKLRQYAGNKTRAAEAIGVSRQFLHRLLVRYGLGGDEP